MRRRFLTLILGLASAAVLSGRQASSPTPVPTVSPRLTATLHPQVPTTLDTMWMVPRQQEALSPILTNFVRGVRLLDEQKNAAATEPVVVPANSK